uniref:DDE Tnp4 domain-containing protein n=1 Tax=Myripristis murdjan TaxID=586833 RepID=A0A668A8V1_9TELE
HNQTYMVIPTALAYIRHMSGMWQDVLSVHHRLVPFLAPPKFAGTSAWPWSYSCSTGDSITSLAFNYRLGEITVSCAIRDTCDAVNRRMIGGHMPQPTEDDWRGIAKKFFEKWNFPNCIGAIDGKHICIQAPSNSGSLYYNYKTTFSVVLMALVDAEYCFRVVHVGDFGRSSDGGVFAGSVLGRGLEAGTLSVPGDAVIPAAEHLGNMPFTVVGDAAFPLKTHLMRPYPGRDISRERNVVENAFGILSSRWRIFHRRINLHPKKVDAIVLTACILYNFLLKLTENQRWLEEQEGNQLEDVERMGGNRGRQGTYAVREKLCQYFSSPEGSAPWQDHMV